MSDITDKANIRDAIKSTVIFLVTGGTLVAVTSLVTLALKSSV